MFSAGASGQKSRQDGNMAQPSSIEFWKRSGNSYAPRRRKLRKFLKRKSGRCEPESSAESRGVRQRWQRATSLRCVGPPCHRVTLREVFPPNLTNDAIEEEIPRYSTKDPDFWVVQAVSAFQYATDRDGDGENACRLGEALLVPGSDHWMSLVFREDIRDFVESGGLPARTDPGDALQVDLAHEILHQFGLGDNNHDDGPIMVYSNMANEPIAGISLDGRGLLKVASCKEPGAAGTVFDEDFAS
jgi:hypothetical protein